MKKWLIMLICIMLSGATLWGQEVVPKCRTCGKLMTQCPYKGRHPAPPAAYLKVNGSTDDQHISFSEDGGTKTFTVSTSATTYTVNQLPWWCKVDQKSSTSFTIRCERNGERSERRSWFSVQAVGKAIRINVRQAAASAPSAKIDSITVEHEYMSASEEGMMIHVAFQVNKMNGRSGQVRTHFYRSDNTTPLYDANNLPLVKNKTYTPNYEYCRWSDYTIFVPYSYLNRAPRENTLSFSISILDDSGNQMARSANRIFTYQQSQPISTAQYQTITVGTASFRMVRVAGGTFTMGATVEQGDDAYNDEYPTHQVTLSSYRIGETEVTQLLWKEVMGDNPSYFKGNNLPVEQVRYDDVQEFIRRLNQRTGRRFRLPTEAEWEYAARGGRHSKGYKYSGSNSIGNVAWYGDNSNSQTHPVKQKQPNELGLYDMSGNVCEWCSDWYGDYSSASQTDPRGAASGSLRVLRGGSWDFGARYCRSSGRTYDSPGDRYFNSGFRLALSE